MKPTLKGYDRNRAEVGTRSLIYKCQNLRQDFKTLVALNSA
jgi:hypothetical protein